MTLRVKIPSLDTETGQRQNCNEYELVQDKYMKNSRRTNSIEQTSAKDRLGNKDNGKMSLLYRETKTDKMQKWRSEIEF